jgi:hypothetical protein
VILFYINCDIIYFSDFSNERCLHMGEEVALLIAHCDILWMRNLIEHDVCYLLLSIVILLIVYCTVSLQIGSFGVSIVFHRTLCTYGIGSTSGAL